MAYFAQNCSSGWANRGYARVGVDVSEQLNPLFSQSLAKQRGVGLVICEDCLFHLRNDSVLDFLVQNLRAHEVALDVLRMDRHGDLGKVERGCVSEPVVLAPRIGPDNVVLSDGLADELLVEFDAGLLEARRAISTQRCKVGAGSAGHTNVCAECGELGVPVWSEHRVDAIVD